MTGLMRLSAFPTLQRKGVAVLLYCLMYRISFLDRSVVEVKIPREMTSR